MKGRKKIVVVGAGMSGLSAGAYILRGGHELLILEKSAACGGHVNSFTKDGFLFDTGPRAIGNAGILKPMLKSLGIELPLVKGQVSTGIKDHIIHYDTEAGISDFLLSLLKLFPGSEKDIALIAKRIWSSVKTARVLNHMPNPFFRNFFSDLGFFFQEVLPRLPGFLSALIKTSLLDTSIEAALAPLSANKALKDMISQHFFKGTPASFAFGYFENFQDYLYPLGGTGRLPQALEGDILSKGGRILTDTEVVKILPHDKKLFDQRGSEYGYDYLLWCADLRSLYQRLGEDGLPKGLRRSIQMEREKYARVKSGESVFTLFIALNEDPEAFKKICRGHFIYTPKTGGLGSLGRADLERIKTNFTHIPKQEIISWLKDFCRYNSYEISIPVLKDPSLAPAGKTGMVVSILFDGEIFSLVEKAQWYEEFKREAAECMLASLEESIFPGLRGKILFKEIATPLSLMKRFNTSKGAITGWSMEEKSPVPHNLAQIFAVPKTALPGVYKAGQWSYSPSGVPIAILSGKIAADKILAKVPLF